MRVPPRREVLEGGRPAGPEWHAAIRVVLARALRRARGVDTKAALASLPGLFLRYSGHPSITPPLLALIAAHRVVTETDRVSGGGDGAGLRGPPSGGAHGTGHDRGPPKGARTKRRPRSSEPPRHGMTFHPHLRGLEVLLVEDAPAGRELALALSAAGVRVTLECNGDSAAGLISRRRHRGEDFDAVILDLGGSAAEAAAAIRGVGFRALLAAVAPPSGAVEEAWRAAGCDVVLPKSAAIEDLARLLLPGRSRQAR